MIRVFPRRTKWTPKDELAFVGGVPLPGMRPPEQAVSVSVTFTDDLLAGSRLANEWRLYYSDVQIGGPACADPGGEFHPGRFLMPGVTITSRGCFRRCPWCSVPEREGSDIRTLPIKAGHIIQDNNLLGCPRKHVEAVFEMLKTQKRIKFSGGLDSRLFERWHAAALSELSVEEMWFACDTEEMFRPLERVANMLDGIPLNKKRCYVLVGYEGESITDARKRLFAIGRLGFLPFAQFYRGKNEQPKTSAWVDLLKIWCRPARIKAALKQDADTTKGRFK